MKKLHRELHYLNPKDISFDENNPRGLNERQIINDPHFKKLVASIEDYGMLEPLVVRQVELYPPSYSLIDGERRLRAAIKSEQEEVPALIAKDDTDGRILAYQIHMLRENWTKAAETKAIKRLISDYKKEKPKISEAEIARKLKQVTAHKNHEIDDLMKLSKYDDEIIDKVIAKELDVSYLVQIEASFINKLKRTYNGLFEKFGENKIRKIMIRKALNGKLINTRYLMDEFKVVFSHATQKDIEKILNNFLEKQEKPIDKALDEFEKLVRPTVKLKKSARKKSVTKKKVTKGTIKKDKGATFNPKKIKVTMKQQNSINDIRVEFEKIGGSFTRNEYEYISEALFCLEKHCLKASTLMIWSAGISRILDYIGRNLSDFNSATLAMKADQRSVWKYFAKDFMKDVVNIENLRVQSKDIHLLCYLVYKQIISATQFNALKGNYQTRHDCAHPTDIKLTPNAAITIFENVFNSILNNNELV